MIRVCELTKQFGMPPHEIMAVDNLSFTVQAGEVFGLLGVNGAGKTTTLRIILGLLEPDSGYAEVNGFRSSEHANEVKSRVGLISTSAGLYQWLTPREVLHFFSDLYGLTPEVAAGNIQRLIQLFELTPFLDRRCGLLSTGQKQRVNLARSLVHDPPVILLDEPTRGLDVFGCQVVFDFLAELKQQQKSIILCTHRVEEAERVCDRFGLMHAGRFAHEGTLAQLQAETHCETIADMFRAVLKSQPPREETSV
jgi:sodium transport system ATP-binding protein